MNYEILRQCEVKRKSEEKTELASRYVLYYKGTAVG